MQQGTAATADSAVLTVCSKVRVCQSRCTHEHIGAECGATIRTALADSDQGAGERLAPQERSEVLPLGRYCNGVIRHKMALPLAFITQTQHLAAASLSTMLSHHSIDITILPDSQQHAHRRARRASPRSPRRPQAQGRTDRRAM